MGKSGIRIAVAAGIVLVGGAAVVIGMHMPRSQDSWEVVQTYCFDCHNSLDLAGDQDFESMSPEHIAADAEVWEAAIRKLRSGYMPPAGAPRPEGDEVRELVTWLTDEIDSNASEVQPGRVSMRRLNRREYEYAIRDLLGLNIDAAEFLPEDNREGHFDNNADALQESPAFVDQYIFAAREIAIRALGDLDAPPVTTTYGNVANMVISLNPRGAQGTGQQQHHIEGMPLGTRGGFMVEHNFPADGLYELTIGDMALAREVPKMEFENTVVALLDGEEFYRTNIGGETDHKSIDQLLDPAVEEINDRLRKIPFNATAGQHTLAVTFVHRGYAESDERTRSTALEGGQTRIQAAHALQIRGPLDVTGLGSSPSRDQIFVCYPEAETEAEACARDIVRNMAVRAFRRPATDEDIDALMAFYASGSRNGGFESGVRDALSAVLASPHFLYRAETAGSDTGTLLADNELASRLAFFLWSSLPDEELLELAAASDLSNPEVLAGQIERMLADDRAISLVDDFTFQWLDLAKLDDIVPDRTFSHASGLYDQRELMKRELQLFIDSVLRSDRSVVELMTADYTFLNERLAMHYGIESVKGARFRQVTLEDPDRHGLLGKGAILSLTAYPNRTSPVLRGAWILERLVGAPPPEPPPDVPQLPTNGRGGGPALTLRERLEQHRESPACFSCHGIMDPLGFALENFNAVGQRREHDNETRTVIDPSGVLPDGTSIAGISSLTQALVADPDVFAQTLTENLLTYALGRSLDYRDMPLVRSIVRDAATDGYRFESIVFGIVSSDAFRMRGAENQTQVALNQP